MKKQDKLDCQKIKEMIINNTLSISALSESHLNMLIEYETERLMECEAEYDMAFMDLCCNALERIHPLSVPTDEKIKEISENAYQEYMNMNSINKTPYTPKTKIYPTKKLLRYFIAAAILLVALTATVAAVWNPFVSWLKERKLIDVKQGEVLENDNGSFSADTQGQEFSSIEEMEKALDIYFDVLDNIRFRPYYIDYSRQGTKEIISLQYNLNQQEISFTIYLKNAPYYKEPLEQTKTQKQIFCDLEWYINTEDFTTTIAFDDDYVYIITADSLDIILTFMEGK